MPERVTPERDAARERATPPEGHRQRPPTRRGSADPVATHRHQVLGSWIFGGFLLVFYIGVFLFGPSVISDQKHQMLGLISAILAGLFAFFMSGTLMGESDRLKTAAGITIRATGGLAAAAGVLLWWRTGTPVATSSQTATTVSATLDSVAASTPTSSASLDTSMQIVVPAETRAAAIELGRADPAYRRVSGVLSKDSISRGELMKVQRSISEIRSR